MTKTQIASLENFTINEMDIQGRRIFHKLEEIHSELMERLDYTVSLAKRYFDTKFIVHDINLGKHTKGSYHNRGEAIDGHFENLTISQQFFFMTLGGFKGIGVYPEWENPGIHGDIRDQDNLSVWFAYMLNNEQEYNYNRKELMELLEI